ncbi:biotin/lipoyl-containing protein [Novacetimonas pomaceti]|uniref:Lipoyl-binding domain-containing protein n=1 Tax=Novacetimonas pomaceti TaxID=2021998 RepID=A0A318QAU6_9PROT|nr:biotin/lipoyl-containing protein [Novacetimonas pomaceti]PYD74661.1 hypothetical protein CFR71_13615 [Novacetimonas pomaceti]
MSNRSEHLLPPFEKLPAPEDIERIAQWLAQAGLEGLELSNAAAGLKLRIRVGQGAVPCVAPPRDDAGADARVGTVAVTAPYFGHLCLAHPSRDASFAPVGGRVGKGDVVALLRLDTLLLRVVAPVAGTVTEVAGQPDALLGYGAEIMRIRPD